MFVECGAQLTENIRQLFWIVSGDSFPGEVLNAIFEATLRHAGTRTNTTDDRRVSYIQ